MLVEYSGQCFVSIKFNNAILESHICIYESERYCKIGSSNQVKNCKQQQSQLKKLL